MKKTVSCHISIEYGNFIREYLAVCEVDFTIDENWGADADGNGGTARRFINHVEILYILDEDGNNLVNYDKNIKQEVEMQAENHL